MNVCYHSRTITQLVSNIKVSSVYKWLEWTSDLVIHNETNCSSLRVFIEGTVTDVTKSKRVG